MCFYYTYICAYRASGFKHQSFFFAFGRCPVRIATRLLCRVLRKLRKNSDIVMTEILNFVSRPKIKNTKRFGVWICSLLQVECGNGENIQAGPFETLVSVYRHRQKILDGVHIFVMSQVTCGRYLKYSWNLNICKVSVVVIIYFNSKLLILIRKKIKVSSRNIFLRLICMIWSPKLKPLEMICGLYVMKGVIPLWILAYWISACRCLRKLG